MNLCRYSSTRPWTERSNMRRDSWMMFTALVIFDYLVFLFVEIKDISMERRR